VLDHVTIRVSDVAASERFHATVHAPPRLVAELVGDGAWCGAWMRGTRSSAPRRTS